MTAPTHNLVLEVLAGGGLIMVSLFIAMIYYFGKQMRSNLDYFRSHDAVLGRIAYTIIISQLIFLVGGIFHSAISSRFPIFLIGISVLLVRLRNEQTGDVDDSQYLAPIEGGVLRNAPHPEELDSRE